MAFEFNEQSHSTESAHAQASLFDEAYETVASHVSNTLDWIERTGETAFEKLGSLLLLDEKDDFDPRSGDRIAGKYGFSEDGSEVTLNDDGSTTTVTAGGQTVTEYPDGRSESK